MGSSIAELKELLEVFEKSIVHWGRMVHWVKKQKQAEKPSIQLMWDALNVTWNYFSCDVCYYYKKHKDRICPLNPQCTKHIRNCSPEWYAVNRATSWNEWIQKARIFVTHLRLHRNQIQRQIKTGG